MTVIEDIVDKARGLAAAGKRPHEVIEAVLDLGQAAGFTVIARR
jgi:hypothetical protein